MKENKSKIGLGILIGVLISLVICITGFIIFNQIDKKQDTGNNGVSQVENNINNDKKCIDNLTTAEKLMLDTNRDISKGYTYKLYVDGTYYNVTLENSKQISINIDWYKIKKVDSSVTKESIEKKQVSNFNQEISDIFIGGIGNDLSAEKIILIMKDGTLEYINIWDYISGNISKIEPQKINGVENVIKLYYATESFELNNTLGGGMTVLAQKADGTYYNLSQFVK